MISDLLSNVSDIADGVKLSPRFSDVASEKTSEKLVPNFSDVRQETTPKSEFMPDFKQDQDKEDIKGLKTRNENLVGQNHPVTNVPFIEKPILNDIGEIFRGVFPEFKSVFEAILSKDLYKESDAKQFAECNKQLKEKVNQDPEFAKIFDKEQIEQINNGDTPDGYTWHHNEETGKMQLVDSEAHAATGHTGGRSIWGGGNVNR